MMNSSPAEGNKLWDKIFDKPTLSEEALEIQYAPSAPVPSFQPMGHGTNAFVVENLLTPEECKSLIASTENAGYSYWNPEDPDSFDFRSAYTVEIDAPNLAKTIWSRLSQFFQDELVMNEDDELCERGMAGSWIPSGIYTKMLFARYYKDQHFGPHTDGATILDANTRSFRPVLIYLNTVEEGGGTKFLRDGDRANQIVRDEKGRYTSAKDYIAYETTPAPGRCAVFFHTDMHEASPIVKGVKYILRTDMLFSRKEPVLVSEEGKEAFRLWLEGERVSELGRCDEGMRLFRKAWKLSPELAKMYGM
eukprot:Selendium_serpulae@DN4767_c0_g1_i1.p1